ncbi:TMEM165/GDT1 family protein [Jatrophihabitans sp. DSM 45814]
MNVLLIPLVFAVILIAELPDKSMFASLVLGTRFKARWVFLGVATAFVVHVIIAVTAGGLLTLLPHRILEGVVAALFLGGAAYMWYSAGHEEDDLEDEGDEVVSTSAPTGKAGPRFTAFATSFAVIFLGEWGDITQILTANLAAKYHDPVAVGIGAVLGLWAAALLAITLGRTLLRYISVALLQRVGAVILLAFALYTVVQILR